jgi:menaquinone-dependent protoporphyrinogen oxidase
MDTLIVYASSHGCTETAAKKLIPRIKGQVTLINIKKDPLPDVTVFDPIIIGGSIHAGQIQGKIKKFCVQNLDTLLQKKVGLFLCCMEEGDKRQEQFDNAYPAQLRNHAKATGFFGGEFNFDKMNFLQRAIIKKIAKVSENVSKVDEDKIIEFAETMNKQ